MRRLIKKFILLLCFLPACGNGEIFVPDYPIGPPDQDQNSPASQGGSGNQGEGEEEDSIPPALSSDAFMDEIVEYLPGPFAGFGQGSLPHIVLGGPQGKGPNQGGTDVLSLGVGGSITLRSITPILDGPGEDFIIFENPFNIGGNPETPFAEVGEVSVSQNGSDFFTFACEEDNDLELFPGCAGISPVTANVITNSIDPTDPEAAGGDAFDLNELGLSWIQYIKIEDLSAGGSGNNAGFDLDAIAIVYQ